jgi:hypothetical protein
MQDILDTLKQASEILARPGINKTSRGLAISLLRSARNRLETFIATLEVQQRS